MNVKQNYAEGKIKEVAVRKKEEGKKEEQEEEEEKRKRKKEEDGREKVSVVKDYVP